LVISIFINREKCYKPEILFADEANVKEFSITVEAVVDSVIVVLDSEDVKIVVVDNSSSSTSDGSSSTRILVIFSNV